MKNRCWMVRELLAPKFRQMAEKAGKAFIEPVITGTCLHKFDDDDYKWIKQRYREILKLSPDRDAVRM